VETYRRRSPIGLVGERIDVKTGKWTSTDSHISGGIDSYYEYLWKCWRQFGDQECLQMWNDSIAAINKYLADRYFTANRTSRELWYGHADMNTGERTKTEFGALDAFFPALLAFSGQVDQARALQDSVFKMWSIHAIEPESLNYRTMAVTDPGYELRPEIVESTYYLYHLTGDPKYLDMGQTLFEGFVKYCRNANGYAALDSVITKAQKNAMESYVFAETFKYFYLLFAPPATLDFDHVVLNTEGHPLRRF